MRNKTSEIGIKASECLFTIEASRNNIILMMVGPGMGPKTFMSQKGTGLNSYGFVEWLYS